MGMTIDEAEKYLRLMLGGMKYAVRYWKDLDNEESDIEQTNVEAVETALDTMRKYQMWLEQYEARLKADMVAMLTDIQTEIKELWNSRYDVWLDNQYYIGKSDTLGEVDEVIQDKINVLKEVKDGSN